MRFTESEQAILSFLKAGVISNDEIAQKMKLKTSTVKLYLHRIYEKYDLTGFDAKSILVHRLISGI